MNNVKDFRRPLLKFFLLTYFIFLVLFTITGVVIMLKAPKLIQNILPIVCAWTPNFTFVILFKKLYPGLQFREFFRMQFCTVLKIPVLITVVVIQIFIFLVVMFSYSIMTDTQIPSFLVTSFPVLALGFFSNLIRGPLGEELGWRGYALNELQKRFSPGTSAVIIGAVWGFWHAPLWFATSGYSGVDLLKYAALFMISIISLSIIITAFYNLGKNLMIPVIIHFLFNYSFSAVNLDVLQVLYYAAPLYLIFAILLLVVNPEKALFSGFARNGKSM